MSKKHKISNVDNTDDDRNSHSGKPLKRKLNAARPHGEVTSRLMSVPLANTPELEEKVSINKVSGKKKDTDNSSSNIKSSRSVDTLFRNAYRAQLDMLSLAATKANIMISLNGLLMSILVISGTHFIEINGLYVIPIAIFLTCCAIATSFAAISARPEISRDKFTTEDFDSDKARLLVFEELADLDREQYQDAMVRMLGDRQRIYGNMISHVHDLGSTADRKFKQLYYSYTVFIVGVILTVFSMLTLMGLKWLGFLAL